MEIPESQNSRDARIEQLWQKLDPQRKGELDVNGLRKGLSRIDHRKPNHVPRQLQIANKLVALKNAHDMLKDVVKAMDKNGDEVIQYEGGFCTSYSSLRFLYLLLFLPSLGI
jgi:solute carrier family 25 phosphate transporter 23/24/25/41